MAIKITKKGDKFEIELGNGHAQALSKIKDDYGIIDEERALGFILSVMRDANGKPVDTTSGRFVPSENIKKDQKVPEKNDPVPKTK